MILVKQLEYYRKSILGRTKTLVCRVNRSFFSDQHQQFKKVYSNFDVKEILLLPLQTAIIEITPKLFYVLIKISEN